MAETSGPALSVAGLIAEREARRRRDKEAEEQLQRRHEEELANFKQRLENFQLTDARVQTVLDKIRRAFDRGETELMLTSFPSSFCTDGGRAVNNADVPPLDGSKEERPGAAGEPVWLATLPGGARLVYDYWKTHLQPGGFQFSARILNYPGGVPGDVGLFFSWPKSGSEEDL